MTIDEMMAEIRRDHPEADFYGQGGNWKVRTGVGGDTLARSPEKHRAAELALQAVRKARPKPMTVAEAKAAVKLKHKSAWAGMADATADNGPPWFIWVGGLPNPLARGDTEGQAWKAAAAAIQSQP